MASLSQQAKYTLKEGNKLFVSGNKMIEDNFEGETKASIRKWYDDAKVVRDEIKSFPVYQQPEQEDLEKFDKKKLRPVFVKILDYYKKKDWGTEKSKPKAETVEPIVKKTPAYETEAIAMGREDINRTGKRKYETEAIAMGGEDINRAGKRRPPPKKSKSKEPPTPAKLSAVSDIHIVRKKAQELLGDKYNGEEVPLDISTRKGKKYMIQVPNGRKKIHFGDLSSADYTKHKDEKRLRDFQKRNVKWKNYPTFTPAWMSYHLLW